jgi:hypothetical protein
MACNGGVWVMTKDSGRRLRNAHTMKEKAMEMPGVIYNVKPENCEPVKAYMREPEENCHRSHPADWYRQLYSFILILPKVFDVVGL